MGQYGQGAYESWTPVQIFDPTTANMVLSSMDRYSALLQRERERALQEEKDFLKDYGDFYSSVPGATEAYYNEGVGKIQNAIAQAQAAGIDLTRSIEGRNLLHRLIASVDVGKMNQLKQQKEAYDNYNKALDTLVLKGEITPEQAAWKRKNDGVDTFTALDGNKVNMFNGTVAGPMHDLNSFVDTVAGNIEKSFIKTEGGYDLSGVSGDRIRSVVGDTLNEYLNTDGGAYAFDQYMKAKGYDLDQLTEDQRKALRNDPNEIAEFKEYATDLAVSKREGIAKKLNPIAEEITRTNQNIRQYKATHPNEFNKDGNPVSPAPTVDSQSYVRDVYDAAVGKVFGVDGYTASHMIEGEDGYTNAGQNIFKREESILRDYKCDVDKCISAHTSIGNLQSNIKMLDVPMGGSTKESGNLKTTLNQNQFLRQNTKKKIYDASQIIFNTAGYYKKDKPRTKEQDDNYKDLNKATYFTVTNEVVGHLHKGGRFILYVKVIGNNGSVGYIPMSVYSNKKEGGHSYSAKNKSHDQDLGYDTQIEESIKQRDLQATNVYTKEGSATNNGALEREAQN